MPVQQEEIPRVPVVCTGNDFSTLYAPLIRDGRMEKFYWAPTREDRIGVAMGIFQVHSHLQRTWLTSSCSRTSLLSSKGVPMRQLVKYNVGRSPVL